MIERLSDLLVHSATKYPGKAAALEGARSLSYGRLAECAARLAAGLAARGLAAGDRVAVAGPNCLEFLVAYWGLQWAGMVPVPVNFRMPREAVAHAVAHTGCRLALAAEDLPEPARQGLAAAGLERIALGGAEWEALLAREPAERVLPGTDDLAIVMHTSGTTGLPKGAMMTQATSLFNIRMAVVSWGWRHEDTHLLVIPLFHCTAAYSAMPSSVYLGSTLVLGPRTDPGEILELVERHRVSTFLGVPSLFHLVASRKDLAERDLASLRMAGYSGSPMPRATIERLRRVFPGVRLHNFFGLTESISNTHVTADEDADLRPESIGKPLPEVFQRIVDEEGRPVAAGTVGELCLARENVIPGYWGQEGMLEESVRDGWFHTGDLALVDADGYTYLRGRKKDMIIVAGENVYALEVERVLVQHPRILEAAVVGVPATGAASYLGELVKAVVVLEGEEPLAPQEIRRFCAERMATYQVPAVIEFRAELPRTPSGKVLKQQLV